MTANLRSATVSDFDSIAALLAAHNLPLDGVKDCITGFIVAEVRGQVVGSIAIERYGDFGLLRSAAVSESLRGQSLGKNLVDRALEKASQDGIREVFLLTTTAEEYFPRFGFSRMQRAELPKELHASEELKGACPDTAIVMGRKL